MSYTITKSNGEIITVADGTLNNQLSVTLVGKNYPAFGRIQNENFVKLLENGANSTPPANPTEGELWWDSANRILNVYNGTSFKNVGTSTAQPTPPTGAVVGDLWFDTINEQLKVYDGTTWGVIGPPYTSAQGQSGAFVEQITDSLNVQHVVLKLYVANSVVAMISGDQAFTPSPPIAGFQSVNPGVNLANTGVIPNVLYTGEVQSARQLGNLVASQLMRSDTNTGTTGTLTVANNLGLTLGVNGDAKLSVTGTTVNLDNQTNNGSVQFRTRDANGSVVVGQTISSTGSITFPKDVTILGALNMPNQPNNLVISNTMPSTSTVTGALVVAGGVGIGGTLNVAGNINGSSHINTSGNVYCQTVVAANLVGNLIGSATNVGTLQSLNVTGNVTAGGFIGPIYTANQTRITSVGTLANLTVAGFGIFNNGLNQQVSIINSDTDGGINLGYVGRGASGTPYVNFSSSTNSNYDAQISVTGGTTTVNNGVMSLKAATVAVTNALTVGSTIVATGDITAFSDASLKTNVKTIDNALELVNKLRGVSYDRVDGKANNIGVIAQEVQAVLPQVVSEQDNGLLAVAYGNMVGLLIEAVKELSAQVEELKKK